jgi:hypothetical protein
MEAPMETWEHFLNWMTKTCDAHEVELVDHHNLDRFVDSHFVDFTHLNNEAAKEYSAYLGEALVN